MIINEDLIINNLSLKTIVKKLDLSCEEKLKEAINDSIKDFRATLFINTLLLNDKDKEYQINNVVQDYELSLQNQKVIFNGGSSTSFLAVKIKINKSTLILNYINNNILASIVEQKDEKNNEIKEYNGIVSDYISQNPKVSIEKEKTKKEVLNIPRFTSQEKKEFDNIESVIEEIENKIKLLKEEQIIYSTDYQKLIELNEQIEKLEILLLEKLERWEYLNNINEQIIEYKNNKYK